MIHWFTSPLRSPTFQRLIAGDDGLVKFDHVRGSLVAVYGHLTRLKTDAADMRCNNKILYVCYGDLCNSGRQLWACGTTHCGESRPSGSVLSGSEMLDHAKKPPTCFVVVFNCVDCVRVFSVRWKLISVIWT